MASDNATEWLRLKALVLDSISSPITRRVYNLGLDEFIAWYTEEPRPGFTKATVAAWRVALEARKLGPISINVRLIAVRKLAVEAADNGLLAPALASGIARIKGVRAPGNPNRQLAVASPGTSTLERAGHRDGQRASGPRDSRCAARLWTAPVGSGGSYDRAHSTAGRPLVHHRSRRQAPVPLDEM